jgi:hypothetical protein
MASAPIKIFCILILFIHTSSILHIVKTSKRNAPWITRNTQIHTETNAPAIKDITNNKKRCWWWHLMEHIHNNLKLGGSLGNVPQNWKKKCYKNSIYFGVLVHFKEYNLYCIYCINCTLENRLTPKYIEFL